MAKSKMTLAGRADRMARAVFANLASERVPDHLMQLVDELEVASKTGCLRKADRGPHDLVDRAIDDMIRDGSLMQLSLKWFAMDITPHRCACKPF